MLGSLLQRTVPQWMLRIRPVSAEFYVTQSAAERTFTPVDRPTRLRPVCAHEGRVLRHRPLWKGHDTVEHVETLRKEILRLVDVVDRLGMLSGIPEVFAKAVEIVE
jgi:hypothetical protein